MPSEVVLLVFAVVDGVVLVIFDDDNIIFSASASACFFYLYSLPDERRLQVCKCKPKYLAWMSVQRKRSLTRRFLVSSGAVSSV